MEFPPGVFEAVFVGRPNRFVSLCERGGETLRCFCPDPGRLAEFTTPGRRVLVAPAAPGAARRTAHTQVAFHHEGEWVSVVTAMANGLVREAWETGLLPEIPPGSSWRAEVKHGASRIDWAVESPGGGVLLLEAKSATLVEGGVALFPDAPTLRGARHVRELAAHARVGGRAGLVFVVQRGLAREVRPHAARDPAFAAALREAAGAGVWLAALACEVDEAGVRPRCRLPVLPEAA